MYSIILFGNVARNESQYNIQIYLLINNKTFDMPFNEYNNKYLFTLHVYMLLPKKYKFM